MFFVRGERNIATEVRVVRLASSVATHTTPGEVRRDPEHCATDAACVGERRWIHQTVSVQTRRNVAPRAQRQQPRHRSSKSVIFSCAVPTFARVLIVLPDPVSKSSVLSQSRQVSEVALAELRCVLIPMHASLGSVSPLELPQHLCSPPDRYGARCTVDVEKHCPQRNACEHDGEERASK